MPLCTVLEGGVVSARTAAGAAVTLKLALVAAVNPVAVAINVYPDAALLRLSVEKIATPETAPTVVVPASVPPPGFVPKATVTLPVNPVAVLPLASSAVTCTAGVMLAPATVAVGCTVKTRLVGGPAVTLNAALVPVVSPAAAAVSV